MCISKIYNLTLWVHNANVLQIVKKKTIFRAASVYYISKFVHLSNNVFFCYMSSSLDVLKNLKFVNYLNYHVQFCFKHSHCMGTYGFI